MRSHTPLWICCVCLFVTGVTEWGCGPRGNTWSTPPPWDASTWPDSVGLQDQKPPVPRPDVTSRPEPTSPDTGQEPSQGEPAANEVPASQEPLPDQSPNSRENATEPLPELPPEPLAPEPLPDSAPPEPPAPPISRCLQTKPPTHTGKTLTLSPGKKLLDLLKQAKGGDRILVKQGTYPSESIQNIKFTKYVIIQAEQGAKPIFEGMDFRSCAYLSFQNILVRKKTFAFRDASYIWLDKMDIDLGTNNTSGLQFVGSGANARCHHLDVHNSRITGGQRTIFIRTNFTENKNWNHDIKFTYNTLGCGTNNCFQLSGARDMLIQNNSIKTIRGGTGILLAGATRIQIRRNRLTGDKSKGGGGMNISTPGKQWDNFRNVKYMITSYVTIANNVVTDWKGTGIYFGGSQHIDIVNNTIFNNNGGSIRLQRRVPLSYDGQVILTGNTDFRLWNNILNKLTLDSGEARPTLESNNLVKGTGGGGKNLLKADPMFQSATNYSLKAASPAIDAGLKNKDTPGSDVNNTPRDNQPDLGAIEHMSTPATCP